MGEEEEKERLAEEEKQKRLEERKKKKEEALAAKSLPAGWEQVIDPSSGTAYYFNSSTGETTWTPPASSKESQSLPAGWEKSIDPSSGKTYYFKRSTGETSWTTPTESGAVAPPAGRSQANEEVPEMMKIQDNTAAFMMSSS